MAAVKSRSAIWTAQVLTAGAGNTSASWIDLSTVYGAQVDIKLTNGATGPTVAAQVQVLVAAAYNAGAPQLPVNYGGALIGQTGNNAIAYFSVEIPIGVATIQLVAGSNTVQNVTVDADISNVTGI